MRDYVQLLPYAFKRFSVLSLRRTLLPTLAYYATRSPLPPSAKPALFTMNILPPMMTVWYHLARKALGDGADIVIFDCCGCLKAADFPGARVQKFINLYAAAKSDEFLRHIARHRDIGWICDDDMFLLSHETLRILEREFADPKTASVSFRPRPWWHFEIDGLRYEPGSSYCIAFNRSLLVEKEHLSLAPRDGNTHPSHIGKPPGRYDTGDWANEVLLRKGYRCCIASPAERRRCVTGFSGMSGAVMLLWYFRRPEQVMEYLRGPPRERWQGNMLFGLLSGLLAICTIQDCHEKLRGRRYPLPSLPSRSDLEKLRRDVEPLLLRSDHSFRTVDAVSEQLIRLCD